MAITNYTELQSSIRNRAARADTTNVTDALVQEFIGLAEDRLEYMLPIRAAIDWETLTGTAGSRVLTPTSGFVTAYELHLSTYSGRYDRLTPYSQGTLPYSDVNSQPTAWMVVGQTIELDSPCDQAHTFEFLRRVRLYDLATTDPNWLLTNHPGVYLAACMVEYYAFIQDESKEAKWEARLQELVHGVESIERPVTGQAFVDPALSYTRKSGFNINSGYY